MTEAKLYPLRFDPIFQYRLWGGRRLGAWLNAPLPDGPIGEAWVLSDRDDHPSLVAEGPLKGVSINKLMQTAKTEILGNQASQWRRFPLLLKFLDVEQMLSVQVHPRDDQTELIPKGESGKTEAWVVLQADAKSRIYAGLKPGVDADALRSLSTDSADKRLASFPPKLGQAVLIQAGTVHSLGDGVMVFEVQENSDVTFRLYDWDHVDAKTGKRRDLQVDDALASVNFERGPVRPLDPILEADGAVRRERLIEDPHFRLGRVTASAPFSVGRAGEAQVLVCVAGEGSVAYGGQDHALTRGGVMLLPAVLGQCPFTPKGEVVILEVSSPENP